MAVTPANREYLRALRSAELLAWKASRPSSAGSSDASLRQAVAAARQGQRKEGWLLLGFGALVLAAVGIGMATSFEFVRGWDAFVAYIRAWLA